MSSALDMSLEDIIKKDRGNNNRSRPSSSSSHSGPTRHRGTGRSYNQHSGPMGHPRSSNNRPYHSALHQYRNNVAAVAPLHTSVIRQSIPDGSKVQVSNLDHRVTSEDLKLVFSTRVGPLKKCTLMFDERGHSTGTAMVHFERVTDAALAMQRFNGVPLDGLPMKIEMVVASGAAPVVFTPPPVPSMYVRPVFRPQNRGRGGHIGNSGRGRAGGNRGGRSSGVSGGSGGGGERKESKTVEQLDAEMNEYNMQVDDS